MRVEGVMRAPLDVTWEGDARADWPPNVQAVLKKRSPASELLGLQIAAVERARARVRLVFDAKAHLCNKWGAVQGGMVAAMLDDAMALAVGLDLAWGQISPTLELKVSMLAPLRVGKIIGEGQVLRRGRTIGFVTGALATPAGALLATGSSTASFATLKKT